MDKMPAELVDKMCTAIVGFDLPIAELQSKWKLNQNRGADDRAGVVDALDNLGGEARHAVAAIMRSRD
jgi:transcriptional regulator